MIRGWHALRAATTSRVPARFTLRRPALRESLGHECQHLRRMVKTVAGDAQDLGFIAAILRHDHEHSRVLGLKVELDASQSLIGDVEPHMVRTGDEDPSVGDTDVCAPGGEAKLDALAGLQQVDDRRVLNLWVGVHGVWV